jgi:hypothetical protein
MTLRKAFREGLFSEDLFIRWAERQGLSKTDMWAVKWFGAILPIIVKLSFAVCLLFVFLCAICAEPYRDLSAWLFGGFVLSAVASFALAVCSDYSTRPHKLFLEEVGELRKALGLKEDDRLDEESLGAQVGDVLDGLALKILETEPYIHNSPLTPDEIGRKVDERRMLKTAFNALHARSATFGIGLADKDGYYHEAAKKFRTVHGK